jgi:hypothetical protein
MSDRRAVSAGHLGASSVAAANEPWRVAVGGNRVESMTVDQIAQAFHSGQLNVRTPLWPPGTTGWQALGNFEQFQVSTSGYGAAGQGNTGYGNAGQGNAGYGNAYGNAGQGNASYGNAAYDAGLSQFEEADDDPTRMWTGSSDELPGLEAMPPVQQRPSARTGTRQVSRPAPSHAVSALPPPPPVASRPVAAQPAAVPTRSMPPTPSLASRTPALVPGKVAAQRQNRGNGLMLVAGLVGLVGLGSAILAARGNWGAASEPPPASSEVAAAPAPAAQAPAPEASAAPTAPEPAAAAPKADAPSEAGAAQLAKYEDTSARASAFVAGEPAKPAEKAEAPADEPKAKSKRERADDAEVRSAGKAERAEKAAKSSRTRGSERVLKKVSARAVPKRAAIETAEQKPPAPVEKVEKLDKPEKVEKAEVTEAPPPPANSAVNEAAAAALANSANLASSCRPRGGPAGPGKARVIYSNDGEVQSVEILTAKFRDTLTGSCVRMVFRRAKIPPFKGEPPTFIKSFTIPEE